MHQIHDAAERDRVNQQKCYTPVPAAIHYTLKGKKLTILAETAARGGYYNNHELTIPLRATAEMLTD